MSLHGRTSIAKFAGRDLQVETLYVPDWAGKFFGVPGLAISPFSMAKAHVESDGSFAVELPDFASDPLWSTLSSDASLMFFLVDAHSGQRVANLSAPPDLSRAGFLKVAASYPAEVGFTTKSRSAGKPAAK
jgi:hypothetical protein